VREAWGVVELLGLGHRMKRWVYPIRRILLSARSLVPIVSIKPSGSSGGTVYQLHSDMRERTYSFDHTDRILLDRVEQ
jgi:hypothetical protein